MCLTTSVIITSYKRGWALRYSLSSLVNQSVHPNEVIIVLRPSGDESERVIKEFEKKLPIRLLIREKSFVDAVEEGIKNATSDVILFIDDMKVYKGYTNYISKSGFLIRGQTNTRHGDKAILDAIFIGANMGFRREAIEDCPLGRFFKRSKKGYSNESFLVYWARRKGFNTYTVWNSRIAPIVWHISHNIRLTSLNNFYDRFWFSYDALMNYFRYRLAGADTSFLSYIIAAIAFIRKDLPPRLASLLYILLTLPKYLKEIRSC